MDGDWEGAWRTSAVDNGNHCSCAFLVIVMPRVQFQLPARFEFQTDIQIYISHVNQGGHLDNAQLLTLVSEARVRYFKALGYTEGDVAGCPIVVGDIVAQYKSEGFHGETMQVSMVAQDFNRYGFDLAFHMACLDTGREVARGKIGIVFVNRQTRKVAEVPAAFLAAQHQFQKR
jgi:acyl-CoA thioester hydrolase